MLKKLLIAITLVCMPSWCSAKTVDGLFSAKVHTRSTSQTALANAFQQGLLQVLTKVSGNNNIATIPAIQNSIQQAQELVLNYRFATNPPPPQTQQVIIKYDHDGVIKILNNNGQAVWEPNRPNVLVWIQNQNNVLSTFSNLPAINIIQNTAQQRGLPIVFPLMDLQDQTRLNNNPLTEQQITQLQQRYHANAILIGNILQQKNTAIIHWHFIYHQQPIDWESVPSDLKTALQNGINQVADTLASRLAIINDSQLQSDYTIVVSNINNLEDFGKLTTLIKKISAIDQYTVEDMNQSGVVIKLVSSSPLASINQALLQSHLLTHQSMTDNADKTLAYSWNSSDPTQNHTEKPTLITNINIPKANGNSNNPPASSNDRATAPQTNQKTAPSPSAHPLNSTATTATPPSQPATNSDNKQNPTQTTANDVSPTPLNNGTQNETLNSATTQP